jgi:endonuclease-3
VGRKTANVILNTAFGHPTMAVDTHIFRVANRTGLAPGKTVLEVENKLIRRVPKEFLVDAHHWLILHGRYVCQARKPKCPVCIIADLCEYRDKTPAPGAAESGKKSPPRRAAPLSPSLPRAGAHPGGHKGTNVGNTQTDASRPPSPTLPRKRERGQT